MLVLAIGAVLLVVLGAAGAVYQAAGTAADLRRYPPPGRMIDIGGSRLHFIESGGDGPPVIFESGISATCLNWTEARLQVAGFARACAYDRAGLGWSDRSNSPRTTLNLVAELHALLEAARIPRPCILVGHSFGGMLVRSYAAKYPEQVAGLVLVDALPASEWLNISPARARMLGLGVKLARRGALLARLGVVRLALALLMTRNRRIRLIPRWIAKLSSGPGDSTISRLVGEVSKMPPEVWPMVQAHWCQPKSFEVLGNYFESLPVSATEAYGLVEPDSLPVIVLSAANSTPEQLKERDALAGRSPHGQHIIAAKSGHWIQLDEPELVVQAIREMVGLIKPS